MGPSSIVGRGKVHSGGFTYLSLVILLAIMALVTASALKLGSVLQRSQAEQQLLTIGAAFSDALQSYADATPPGQPPQPPSLKELLRDSRFPGTRRHLRKIFVDPITGKAEWGVVYRGEQTGVLAVYSLSNAQPIKLANFPPRFAALAGKQHLSDWKFAASGAAAITAGAAGGAGTGLDASATAVRADGAVANSQRGRVDPLTPPPPAPEAPPTPEEEPTTAAPTPAPEEPSSPPAPQE